MALILWLDYNQLAQAGGGKYFTWYVRIIGFILAVAFGATIGYSRLFLGVHSLNQILFGWLLGVWLAFTMHFIFKDKIMKNARKLLHG